MTRFYVLCNQLGGIFSPYHISDTIYRVSTPYCIEKWGNHFIGDVGAQYIAPIIMMDKNWQISGIRQTLKHPPVFIKPHKWGCSAYFYRKKSGYRRGMIYHARFLSLVMAGAIYCAPTFCQSTPKNLPSASPISCYTMR
jgi:hypothetical protein